jgi:hypothetical protein
MVLSPDEAPAKIASSKFSLVPVIFALTTTAYQILARKKS